MWKLSKITIYDICDRWTLEVPRIGPVYVDKHSAECQRLSHTKGKFEVICFAIGLREKLRARSTPKAKLEAERVLRAVLDEMRAAVPVSGSVPVSG